MEYEKMETSELIERRAAIAVEVETADAARLDELEVEARQIKEELEKRKAAESQRAAIRETVAQGAGELKETFTEKREKREMTIEEIRKSGDYINAFADYIKTGDDSACRALLTTNAGGDGLPVPVIVEEKIRTAWEKTGLLDLATKTYIKGNLSVAFEVSATDADVHLEGGEDIDEEEITLGVVQMVPASIKKWITVSDEAMDLGGAAFLDYIYDELTYKIAKKAQESLLEAIDNAPAASTTSAVGVAEIEGAPTLDVIANAVAQLGDNARDITVVMNRLTYAAFVGAIAANGYGFDPFAGVRVVYDNSLPAFSAAGEGETWLIVGDFSGAHFNFPNGQEIRIKTDELSLAERDLVKFVGRMYVGIGITAPGAFAKVVVADE